MLFFIFVFMAFIDLKRSSVRAGFEEKLLSCFAPENLYLLDGKVVEWANSIQGHGWLHQCIPNNDTMVEQTFDPTLIVRYAYEELDIRNSPWPPILQTAVTKSIFLAEVTPSSTFGGCSQLNQLYINSSVNLTLVSSDWLTNCTQLKQITLVGLTVGQIRKVLNSVSRVESVNFNGIEDIEDLVQDHIFPFESEGRHWINRLEFSINNNKITADNTTWAEISEAFVTQLSLLPLLETILIISFENLDWCASTNGSSSVTFESLKELTVTGTATTSVCFRQLRQAPKLTMLSITASELEFSELSSSCAPQMRVYFFGESFIFTREDYVRLYDCKEPKKGNVSIDLSMATIVCDCDQSLWITRAKHEGFLTIPEAACSDGTALEDQTCDWLICERLICNTTCVCCDDGNNGLVADCRDANLTYFPNEVLHLDNLTELLIPFSNISTLPEQFPDSLTFVNFYGNDLFRNLDASAVTRLFAVQNRTVRLAANPIICVCDNQQLIKELQRFSDQIEDYEQMVCAGQDIKLSEVNVSTLCAARDYAAMVLTVVTVALFLSVLALILGVMIGYRRHIQIFLFARGWCLFCIDEEELDADRRYDVFLSFCYADERIVIDELLTRLDEDYAVCIHYRDWNPGDMIPGQIWRSVEQSRRTIIVLSRNFIKSLWGLMEFRSAYVSGLSEGRVRVVMVVLDDVLESEDLGAEMRAYIRLNTYVKWGDPWFWDKLRFALPHRPAYYEPYRRNPDIPNNYLVYSPEMLALNAVENAAFEHEVVQNSAEDSAVITQDISELVASNGADKSSDSIENVENSFESSIVSDIEIEDIGRNNVENDSTKHIENEQKLESLSKTYQYTNNAKSDVSKFDNREEITENEATNISNINRQS